tara:strand:+ start:578 stop:715 length:138 start_codon:yes stop_codon:yes gene_type:complete
LVKLAHININNKKKEKKPTMTTFLVDLKTANTNISGSFAIIEYAV